MSTAGIVGTLIRELTPDGESSSRIPEPDR